MPSPLRRGKSAMHCESFPPTLTTTIEKRRRKKERDMMVKRPRTADSNGNSTKWSLSRLGRPSTSQSATTPEQFGISNYGYQQQGQDSLSKSSGSKSTSDEHSEGSSRIYLSEGSSSPQNNRSTGTVAKELVHGFQSFVTGRMNRPKADQLDGSIRVEDLAVSGGDAFQLGVWTPDAEYDQTLRIRDEYLRLMEGKEVKGAEMGGVERGPCSSEASDESGSSHSPCTKKALVGGTSQAPLSLEELEVLDTLGTGTFGRVMLVRRRGADIDDRSNYYAMKVLNKSQIVRLKQVEHINSERTILSMANHPFIVNLHCTFQDSLNCYMLMEFVVGGEIFTHLRKAKYFSADVTRFYMSCLVLAIAELHSKRIIYRDLKPENLLIDASGYIKMTDFGFSKQLIETDRTWTLCGTPEYLSPEVILSRSQSFASDYWCLGILMYEMLVGHPPFYDSTPFGTYEKIVEAKVNFPRHIDPVAKDLISSLLKVDVTKRLGNLRNGAQDVMNHAWFRGVDWQGVLQQQIPAPFKPNQKHPSDSSNFEKYSHFDISNMPAMHVGMQADREAQESDPWKHLFTAF